MSGFGVHDDEMPDPTLDEAITEAFLSGRTTGAALPAGMASFAEDLHMAMSGAAPAPQQNLATLLAEGLSIDKGDLPATAASNVHGPATQAAGLPKWRRKKMIVSELLTSLGLAAKVSLGLGIAAASVTGAGAAGVLPEPVQHAVASAVSTVTPFQFPDKANAHATVGGTVSTDATGASDGTVGVDGKAVAGSVSGGAGGGASSTGLDKANSTPAAGHAPTSVPTPAGGSGSSSTGLDKANSTPAAGHAPTSVPTPAGGSASSSTGLDIANNTPAAGHAPTSVPTPATGSGAASTGLGTAASTPAGSHVPTSPGRP